MKNGFSLVEILISIAILTVVTIGALAAFNIGNTVFFGESGLTDLQQEARRAMDGIIREIRQAKQEENRPLTVTNDGGTITFFIPGFNNPISYSLQNGEISRTHMLNNGLSCNNKIALNISALNFCCEDSTSCESCEDSKLVRVELQAQKTVNRLQLTFPSHPGAIDNQKIIGKARLR